MKRHPLFFSFWVATNAFLLVALVMFGYSVWWEYSTRRYLEGFADAVVPLASTPEEKVEAILAWMGNGPERRHLSGAEVSPRDPEYSLNFQELLKVCGTATNAFINLAASSGLEARRLLLLTEERVAKHVVAEVHLGDRFAVVDPLYRRILRDAAGRPVSKEQLRDPETFREVTAQIPGYVPDYTFERTSHVRLSRIPLVGRLLRRMLDRLAPGWDSAGFWSLLLERESFAFVLGAGVLVVFSLAVRWMLSISCERRLGIGRVRLRHRLAGAWKALFGSPA